MKEMMKGMQGVEKKVGTRLKVLPLALLGVLSPQELYAQGLSSIDEDGVTVTEVKASEVEDKKETTIDLGSATIVKDDEGILKGKGGKKKPGITGGGDGDDDEEGPDTPEGDDLGEKDGGKIDVHGKVRGGSDVTPLLGSVLSDNPALLLSIDASHSKIGLGITITRLDDFDKSMDNPASQMTVLDFYWKNNYEKHLLG